MAETKIKNRKYPGEAELAGYLDGTIRGKEREIIESHLASCDECLNSAVSAYEAVRLSKKKGKSKSMRKINLYLIFCIISFILSFAMPRYFIQLLVATLLLGIKWVADSKSTKMLITIYEAWKHGGEKEASKVLNRLGEHSRF